MIRRATAAGLVLGLLAACAPRVAEAPRPGPGPAPVPTPVPAPPAPRPPMSDGSVAALPGWADEDHRAALVAWAAGCHVHPGAPERAVCAAAASLAPVATDDLARAFFETRFTAVPATTADGGPGLLTAYFAPEYP
ncbi:MAG: murein transglycosylase, partial [Brevundimonas sp.]